jgi:hypothetical protein
MHRNKIFPKDLTSERMDDRWFDGKLGEKLLREKPWSFA